MKGKNMLQYHTHYEVVSDKNWRVRRMCATLAEATEYAQGWIAKGRARCCKVYRSAPDAFEQVAEFTA